MKSSSAERAQVRLQGLTRRVDAGRLFDNTAVASRVMSLSQHSKSDLMLLSDRARSDPHIPCLSGRWLSHEIGPNASTSTQYLATASNEKVIAHSATPATVSANERGYSRERPRPNFTIARPRQELQSGAYRCTGLWYPTIQHERSAI